MPITQPIYRFTRVSSLRLDGQTLTSVDILLSIVDLNQLKELDISNIQNILIDEIYLLLEHILHLISKNGDHRMI